MEDDLIAERTGLEPAARLSRAPDFQSGRLPFAHLSKLVAIRDLQPRSDCHIKLQWCRLFTLRGRGYLPGRFSTFPIDSVCDQSRIRTYAEVSLISFADCPFRPLAHLVICWWAGRDLNPQSQLRQQIYSLSRYQLRFTYPFNGAEDGIRTRDLNVGNVVLYQLSYFRIVQAFKKSLRTPFLLFEYFHNMSKICLFVLTVQIYKLFST